MAARATMSLLIKILIGLAILHVVGFALWFAIELTAWLADPPKKKLPPPKRRVPGDGEWLDKLS